MIKSFKNKGLEKLFFQDDRSRIKSNHIAKILRILDRLDASVTPFDMNLPGYRLHELKGKEKEIWSVSVSGNWRITFEFKDGEAINVDYENYHDGDTMNQNRKPKHPGEVLREDVIKPLGIMIGEAAEKLGVTSNRLSAFINCRTPLSPEMAVRISLATGTSAESWLFMQAKFDIWLVENQLSLKVTPFKSAAADKKSNDTDSTFPRNE